MNDGTIKKIYKKSDLEFSLLHISDKIGSKYFLNSSMIKKFVGLALFHEKPDGFRLKEYVDSLKTAIDLNVPFGLEDSEINDQKYNMKSSLIDIDDEN